MITRRGFLSGAGIAAAGLGAGLNAARQAEAPLAQHSEASKMKITELETILIDNIDPPTGPGLGVELDMAVVERQRAA